MSTALFAIVLAAALARPAHMWWRHRRGADPCCAAAAPTSEPEDLRARQLALSRQVAALAVEEPHTSEPTAVRS